MIHAGEAKCSIRSKVPLLLVFLALVLGTVTQLGCTGLTSAKDSSATSTNATVSDATTLGTLAVSPASLSFGNVAVGSTSNQSLTLTNSGTTAVTISQATVSGTGFSISGVSLPVTLTTGQSATFTASFAPTATGSATGSATVTSPQLSAPASIGMTGTGVAVLPSITSQPASEGILVNHTASFSVTASGTAPLSYQWKKNGAAISGATSASYTTPAETTADNGAQFTVAVTNTAGTTVSNVAILTVTTSPVAPSITTQPSNQTTTAGLTAMFSVVAAGTSPLGYQWKKNGAAIGGATSSSYTTPVETTADNGAQISVTVTNTAGSATSNAATLTVNPDPIAPSITAQPASQTITAGQTATFSVTASGTAPLSYQWKKNGGAINGATSSSYTTPAETTADNGALFTVTVTNTAGSATSNTAILTVNAAPVAPSITTQPASQTITAGQTATFSVAASGTAPLTYQWKKNGAAIGGATSSSYTTPVETTADNGALFTVTVTNTAGSATSNAATLTVNAAPVAPSITTQPASQSVTSGQTASFSVVASGTAPLSYQWKKNGAAISGATSSSYTTPAETTADNGALFTVTVTNAAGNVTSNAATLTVNAVPVAPSITSQPASQTITSGQTATFSVTASGTAPLTYQWSKGGTTISGATSSSYTTPAETTADNGAQFAVTVTNTAGSATSNAATLTVNPAPVAPSITAQPASQTITSGQTANFSVTATGTAPLTYQWKKNGTTIGGATSSSYTTPAETTNDNGAQFTVVVTNTAGSATSNAATLTVNAAPPGALNPNTSSLSFGNVTVGNNSMQNVIFTNAGTSNITISSVSSSGAGFTVSGISAGQIVTPGGTATLTVTFAPASAGTVSGAGATVTSNASNSPASLTFSGTGVAAVSHSVSLTWTASTSTVSGYNVYRSTSSSGPFTTQVNSSLVGTTAYSDSTVLSGQTYYYVATAVDANNVESGDSNQVTAVIP